MLSCCEQAGSTDLTARQGKSSLAISPLPLRASALFPGDASVVLGAAVDVPHSGHSGVLQGGYRNALAWYQRWHENRYTHRRKPGSAGVAPAWVPLARCPTQH